jgi:hypothetical protein
MMVLLAPLDFNFSCMDVAFHSTHTASTALACANLNAKTSSVLNETPLVLNPTRAVVNFLSSFRCKDEFDFSSDIYER